MTQSRKSKAAHEARSNSLTQMLELEWKCKMQRLQDNNFTPSTSAGQQGARCPPGKPDPKRVETRSSPVHSPTSRETTSHNMKPIRQNSGLPSLSLSLPSLAPELVAVREDSPRDEKAQTPEPELGSSDQKKTVKFSEAEDTRASLSDDSSISSICRSPTWEGYGRQKTKKKETDQKKRGEREENASKTSRKKQVRLSKPPPQDVQGDKHLTTSNRSTSASDLELPAKSGKRSSHHVKSEYPPDAMANHNYFRRQIPTPTNENGKSRGRGFLSGFRHGSTTPVQNTTTDIQHNRNGTQPARPASTLAASMARSRSSEPADNELHTKGRKRASIGNTAAPSSQEQQPTRGRSSVPSSVPSSRSRSQSLLARLWGAASHHDEGNRRQASSQQTAAPANRPASSQDSNSPLQGIPPREGPGQPTKSFFRGRLPRPLDSRSKVSEAKQTITSEPASKLVEVPKGGNATKSKSSHQPDHYVSHIRHQSEDTASPSLVSSPSTPIVLPETHAQEPQQVVLKSKALDEPAQQQSAPIANFETKPRQDGHSQQGSGQLTEEARDDAASALKEGSQTPTQVHTQSTSQEDDSDSGEREERILLDDPLAVAIAAYQEIDRSSITATPEAMKRHPKTEQSTIQETAQPATTQLVDLVPKPLKTTRSKDYIAFVSESYAPPSLELTSPTDRSSEVKVSPSKFKEELDECEGSQEEETPEPPIRSNRKHRTLEKKNPSSLPKIEVADPRKRPKSPVHSPKQTSTTTPHSEHPETPSKDTKTSGHLDETSSGTSEKSNSSACDYAPASSSSATTPNTSRPQSQMENSPDAVATIKDTPKVIPPKVSTPERSSWPSVPANQAMIDAAWHRPIGSTSSLPVMASPTSTASTDIAKNGTTDRARLPSQQRTTISGGSQSATDLPSTSLLPVSKHRPLRSTKNRASSSSVVFRTPIADSRPPFAPKISLDDDDAIQDTADRVLTADLVAAGAAHLEEARKNAPIPLSSSRALRPLYPPRISNPKGKVSHRKGEPIAKMLVECCSCGFFHDMPSRVYECMVKPDSVVEDKLLGVSAQITTMVKCPWCGHGMTTQCCAGYAAVVYLKEKLHGK